MTRARGLAPYLSVLALAATPAAANTAADLYYERSLMVAADSRCRLFTPQLGAALAAAQAQARGAALRAGDGDEALGRIGQSAKSRARAVACDSRDLAIAAGRVRSAFEGYSRLQSMTYPGDFSSWKAERAVSAKTPVWRLSQSARFGGDRVVFGLGGQGAESTVVMATASFSDGRWPYAARIIARDPKRANRPWLGARLSQRAPPRTVSQVSLAQGRSLAEPMMLPAGTKDGVTFRFAPAVATMLQGLDPREAVTLEFVFAGKDRDEVRAAYVEVGDFAAARAFLGLSSR